MSKRKSFLIHIDSLDILDELTDEQAGQLFKAIKSHQLGEEVELPSLIKIAFSPFKNQFARDDEKYKKLCEKNRLIAEKRYATKSTTGKTGNETKPTVTKTTDNKSDSDSDSKSDSDIKIKDTVPPKVKPSIDDEFELFWQHGTHSERPLQLGLKKTNKAAAKKSFKAQFNKLPKDFVYNNGDQDFLGAHGFAMMLIDDVGKRCDSGQFGFENSLHPTTYLNNQRWNDPIESQIKQNRLNEIGTNFDKPEGWV